MKVSSSGYILDLIRTDQATGKKVRFVGDYLYRDALVLMPPHNSKHAQQRNTIIKAGQRWTVLQRQTCTDGSLNRTLEIILRSLGGQKVARHMHCL